MSVPAELRDDLWIVLPHLGAGGAQKVAILAATHFASQGLQLRLVTLLPGTPAVHSPPEGVPHLDLGPAVQAAWLGDHWDRSLAARGRRFLRAQLRRMHRIAAKLVLVVGWPWLRQAGLPRDDRRGWKGQLLRWCVSGVGGPQALMLQDLLTRQKPRRVLALLSRTNMLACQALWDQPTHLVVSERNDPARQSLPFPWPRLRQVLYRRADVVTANTAGVRDALSRLEGLQRLELLPNPLPANPVSTPLAGRPEDTIFLSIARLVPQKGLDVLVAAMARLGSEVDHWRAVLVGDGPERTSLEDQAESLGVTDRISFEGFRPNPAPYLSSAGVFLLPSRFEGMPNALLEAMAQGVPPIVTDASPGPLEVVEDGRSGLVVPADDPDALAKAMEKLATDSALRHRMGAEARHRLESLDWAHVEPLWRSVLALP